MTAPKSCERCGNPEFGERDPNCSVCGMAWPKPAPSAEPELQFVTGTIPICSACLDGEGGECHTPGCILWINRAPDLAIRDMLREHGCTIGATIPADVPSAEPDCEFVNSGQTGARSLDPWCRTHERSAICCLRDARADVPSAEERNVLEAIDEIQMVDLMNLRLLGRHRFVDAMLAIRAAKETKTDG